MTLFLTDEGAVMSLRAEAANAHRDPSAPHARQALEPRTEPTAPPRVLTMRVHGGETSSTLEARRELETRSNYFLGSDPTRWRMDVPNFGEVAYRNVRPGVDLVYHGSQDGRLEYDFVVAPDASPEDLSLDVEGADEIRLAEDGSLEVDVDGHVLRQLPPVVYQVVDGVRRVLSGSYRILGPRRVGFMVASYDRERPLVIDPVLFYATYLGGSSSDWSDLQGIAVDGSGNAFVAGTANSTDFPATSGAVQSTIKGSSDAFVAKLNATGTALAYATYLGGAGGENGYGVAIDSSGNAYLTGQTTSTDFPVTSGAVQGANKGGVDAFVAKLSPTGSALAYATYLGGATTDTGYDIDIDASGNAYVAGQSNSTDFPTTSGAAQTTFKGAVDAFVAKVNPTGTALAYATYLGGTGTDIDLGVAVDASGDVYLAGYTTSTDFPVTSGAAQTTFKGSLDAFVAKLNPTGTALSYATYLGGTSTDVAYGVAIDASGNAFLAGYTFSSNFPVTSGAVQGTNKGSADAFAAKLNPTGTGLSYATYLGGTGQDLGYGVAIDANGNAYVVGNTQSTDFPVTSGAVQGTNTGSGDAFVVKLNPSGNALSYATFLGGAGADAAYGVATDANGNAFIAGYTASANFPVTSGAAQTTLKGGADAFVAKIGPVPPTISPTAATVAPRGSQTFTASGGSGAGYTWTLVTNASGGSIDPSTGAYTAGPTGNVTDIVRVTDSAGGTTTANVTVTAGVSISPASPSTAPMGTVSFAATGGSATGYSWTILTNNSNGTVDPNTGVYTAGAIGNVADTIRVTDSLGNIASAVVSVGAGVSLSPVAPSVAPKGSLSFGATGGSGSYSFAVTTNNSGGSIDPTTGIYAAGPIGSVNDVVTATDSLGNTATATVTVTAALSITPSSPTSAPNGTVTFALAGGSGSGYAWALTTNQSGGSIDPTTGVYTAGATGSVSDVVTATDSLGNIASTTVMVTAGVSLAFPTLSTPPQGAISFVASGGSGTGYVYAISTNASGGSVGATGTYTAGPTGNVSDVVTVTDSLGNTATVTVTVTAGVSLTPSTPSTAPMGSLAFVASGGSNTAFTFGLTTNASGASIDPVTGAYTAGATGNVSDTILVTDSLGNTASVNVSVGAGITVNPATPSTAPKGAVGFSATGGSGLGYTWSIPTNNSGAAIGGSTGAYTAGSIGSVTDTVQVVDSLGNSATATVTVTAGVLLAPVSVSVAPKGIVSFAVSGGSGSGYVYSFAVNNSGGSIDPASGAYAAGTTPNVTDTVLVTDSLGNVATADVSIGAGLTLAPASSTVAPRGSAALTASGGSGGYVYSLAVNASGGSINSSTGAYIAGATPNVTDTVRVVDSNGNSATATVSVSAGVGITPNAPTVAPNQAVGFTATGGSGSGYAWMFLTNASGGTIDASTGAYVAGPTPSVVDIVLATDSLGNSTTVSVSIGAGLAINAASSSTPPRGSLALMATGGSGSYTWSLLTNASGGSIAASSGLYTAGATGSVTDIVGLVDSVGNSTTIQLAVGPSVTILPPNSNAQTGGAIAFSVMGGSGNGYVWSLATSGSGGSIDATGAYIAGNVAGTDVVHVVDSLGNSADANVVVTVPTPTGGGGGADGGVATNDAGANGDGGASGDAGTSRSGRGGCNCDVAATNTSSRANAVFFATLLSGFLLRRVRRAGRPSSR